MVMSRPEAGGASIAALIRERDGYARSQKLERVMAVDAAWRRWVSRLPRRRSARRRGDRG